MISSILTLLSVPEVHQGEAIRGFISFAGILLTGLLGIVVWLGKQWLLRRERRRDLLQSLRAEVVAVWKQFIIFRDPDSAIASLNEGFDKAQIKSEAYTPLIVHETGVSVFPSLINDLVALKEDEIGAIVSFYRQLKATGQLGDYLRTPDFSDEKISRKRLILEDYLRMVSQVVKDAETVLELVDPRLRIPASRRLNALRQRALAGHT